MYQYNLISGNYEFFTYIKSPIALPISDIRFGQSVAISDNGDFLAITQSVGEPAPLIEPGLLTNDRFVEFDLANSLHWFDTRQKLSGGVNVYNLSDDGWVQTTYLGGPSENMALKDTVKAVMSGDGSRLFVDAIKDKQAKLLVYQ